MAQDGVDHHGRVAALGQDGAAERGMLVRRGMLVVVEIVDQAGRAPEVGILAEAPGIGAHGGFHRERVLPQARCLGVLVQQGKDLRTRRKALRDHVGERVHEPAMVSGPESPDNREGSLG